MGLDHVIQDFREAMRRVGAVPRPFARIEFHSPARPEIDLSRLAEAAEIECLHLARGGADLDEVRRIKGECRRLGEIIGEAQRAEAGRAAMQEALFQAQAIANEVERARRAVGL